MLTLVLLRHQEEPHRSQVIEANKIEGRVLCLINQYKETDNTPKNPRMDMRVIFTG